MLGDEEAIGVGGADDGIGLGGAGAIGGDGGGRGASGVIVAAAAAAGAAAGTLPNDVVDLLGGRSMNSSSIVGMRGAWNRRTSVSSDVSRSDK